MAQPNAVEATSAYFIKLGPKGDWEKRCLKNGELRLAYHEVPHEVALAGDKDAIREIYINEGLSKAAASNHARQALAFYDASPDAIWITFANGRLWWCQADSEVIFIGSDRGRDFHGSRLRRTRSGWHDTSINGNPLIISDLSGQLTRVASYQQTICSVNGKALEYLLRKVNGQSLKEVEAVQGAYNDLKQAVERLIHLLTWKDFEGFVEIVFSRSGWQRVSVIGGAQKTIDIEFLLPITGERAVVQVKSRTDQAQFNEYIDGLSTFVADKTFYAYHSSDCVMEDQGSNIELLDVEKLADLAVRVGLVDWLIEKVG